MQHGETFKRLALMVASLVAFGFAPALADTTTPAPAMDFGAPPSGEVPILFNDHHVYATPDTLMKGRVLAGLVRDGELLVPLRSMFEQMGATVSYDAASQTAKASKPGSDVQVTVGKGAVLINGESRPLDVPAMMYKGTMLVPVRVISESLGAYVAWVPEQHLTIVRYVAPTPVPTPVPTAPPTIPPTPAPTPPPIPKDFDPCGGPFELLNKIGNGTACVFVAGEAALTGQYASVNVPSNTTINITTSRGSATSSFSSSAHAIGYPASVVYVGVLPRAQISITPPSFLQVNSSLAGSLTGNNVLAAGATNMKFAYKQLFFVDPNKFTMFAIDFSYTAPTGSQAYRGPGPSYAINPIFTQPLHHNLGVTLAFPVINSTLQNPPTCTGTTCTPGGTQRGWSWTPQLIPYWTSPGGTLLAVFVQHNFNPSVTPVAVSAAQLFGRHFDIAANYGGFTYSSTSNGPFYGLVNASTTHYPTIFSVGVNYLFGHSDLPAALQQ